MMRNFQDRLRPRVRTACHVLLPRLCVAGQQDARPAVAKEDGYRAVVGLGEELPWRPGDDVDRLSNLLNLSPLQWLLPQYILSGFSHRSRVAGRIRRWH